MIPGVAMADVISFSDNPPSFVATADDAEAAVEAAVAVAVGAWLPAAFVPSLFTTVDNAVDKSTSTNTDKQQHPRTTKR
jgi:hypothetical protein